MSAAPARRLWPIALLAVAVTTLALFVAAITALFGASVSCLGGGTASEAGPRPTGAARQIPPARLHIYMGAARRFDISWPFLASIGVQECGYDGHCGVAASGCAGVMEIAYVRGSECSPDPSVPTLWEEFRVDADGGGASIFDPADAIYTAARIFHQEKDAPPAGGSYHSYYEAACSYYGACADGVADYANEVMARAVEFGFAQEGESEPGESKEAGLPLRRHHHRHGPHGVDAAYVQQGSACSAADPAGTGATGSAIVRVARSQLGEAEHPLGSNCTKYGPCEEWCALFVAWVWQHAGVAMAGGTDPYAYSGTFYGWVAEHGGRDLGPRARPAPGDAVIYGWGPTESEHIGIVEAVYGDEIVTIEGNFADRVERVGPFLPWLAQGEGEPGPVWTYVEPPTVGGNSGGGAGAEGGLEVEHG
jgi:CHAP domain